MRGGSRNRYKMERPPRFGNDERQPRITSHSAIKMCIKMSKNIYLHKVKRRRSFPLHRSETAIEKECEREMKVGCGKLFQVAKVLVAYTFSPALSPRVCTWVTHKLQASRSKETPTNDSGRVGLKRSTAQTRAGLNKLQVKPKGHAHTGTKIHTRMHHKNKHPCGSSL